MERLEEIRKKKRAEREEREKKEVTPFCLRLNINKWIKEISFHNSQSIIHWI